MDQDIASSIIRSTQHVFTTMVGLPIEPGLAHREPAEAAGFDGVVAVVGIAGAWSGSGRLSCSSQFACRLAGALLSTPQPAVTEEVLDAVAEVANMIVGNVKSYFEERLGPMGLGIPTAVFGRNYQTRFSGVSEWIVIPFHSQEYFMEVRFCLVPTPLAAYPPRSTISRVA
jgi:chemotaxis protein CheX